MLQSNIFVLLYYSLKIICKVTLIMNYVHRRNNIMLEKRMQWKSYDSCWQLTSNRPPPPLLQIMDQLRNENKVCKCSHDNFASYMLLITNFYIIKFLTQTWFKILDQNILADLRLNFNIYWAGNECAHIAINDVSATFYEKWLFMSYLSLPKLYPSRVLNPPMRAIECNTLQTSMTRE